MKLHSWGAAALAACALLASASRLPAQQAAAEAPLAPMADGMASDDMGADLDAMEQSELGSYNSCSTCSSGCSGCPSCSAGGGGMGGFLNRPIQLVVGAEYIYAKANFSDALAFVEQDLNEAGETWHCFDFDYNSSFSVYGGIYLPDCGGAVIFDYTRLTSDASTSAQSVDLETNIFGPFEVDDNIEGFADVEINNYDLGFAKTIPLGCPLECGKSCGDGCDDACCDSTCCGDGCGGCWCPAWDITWMAGIRYADVNWARGLDSFDPLNDFAFIDGYRTTMNFDGFGGRVGLMGRRYIGRRGLVSLYARGDWSLLIGDVELETLVTNAAGTAFHRKDCEQIIPVTEIELGSSIHLGSNATLSAGYFLAAWHDLGMSETYTFPQFQVSHYDDGNILGFDGAFARVEIAF
jgi:hypothetical protein